MKAKEENGGTVSAPEEDLAYFEIECSSAWYVIEAVLEDVYGILRRNRNYEAASCLRSAYIHLSCYADFAMGELREGTRENRDEVHMDYIRGSCLKEMQREAISDDRMLRLLLDGMNSKSEEVEKKRSKAIEYMCERLSRSARGIVYHTCREEA